MMAKAIFQFLLGIILIQHAVSFIHIPNILELMTENEILSIFNAKLDAVPEYEVVSVYHKNNVFRTRSMHSYSSQLELQAFGKNISLYLESTNHLLFGENTPIYSAVKDGSQPLGIKYTRLENAWPKELGCYQDLKNQAAITITRDPHNNINVEGVIGEDLVLKPIPSRIQKNFSNHMPQSRTGFKNQPRSRTTYKNIDEVTHHIIYKSKKSLVINRIKNFVSTAKRVWNNLFDFRRKTQRFKRSVFDTVHPQLLIIVDYETFKTHENNIEKLTRYMAAFWNGVDLRYRDMIDPKIRLNIAGLIIPQEEGAAPYMEYHRRGVNLLEDRKTLDALGRYLYHEKRFSSDMYDIAVAITNLDLCMMEPNYCNPAAKGLAYIGGACKHDYRYTDLSVALLEDSGGFSGIATAAHELGHLFGAPHDGDDSLSYIGGPGAKQCDWNDGFLMSSTRRNSRGLHWSACSIDAMQYFLKNDAYCLRDKPLVSKPHSKILPGKLISRDKQCKRITNTLECEVERDDCGVLWCAKPDNASSCTFVGAPAEGSSCIDGGICLDGDCVLEPKELISTNY